MKHLLMILLTGLALNASATDNDKLMETLDKAANLYLSLNDDEVEHYYLHFALPDHAEGLCHDASNFVERSGDIIVARFTEYAVKMNERRQDQNLKPVAQKEIDDTAAELKATLANRTVKICTEDTVPPYSDGDRKHYVDIDNGDLLFMFGYGLPD